MTKLLNFRLAMLCALSSVAGPRHDVEAANWWGSFVREMEAIGCVNIRQDLHGEWAFDCPEAKLPEARAIVKRYHVK